MEQTRAKTLLASGVARLAQQQALLYAQDTYSVLLIFQAMDAAGKDGAIKHVLSGVNPQGCQVYSFKAPSAEEHDHTYLWRSMKALPERGRIGIHNRSHYEEVLIARVHKEVLAAQQLPDRLKKGNIWKRRFREINDFESHLADNGTVIIKFFLHVSKEEQKRRFLARIDEDDKNWKFSVQDANERAFWSDYMEAYEDALSETSIERRTVVRGAGRQQMVYATGGRRHHLADDGRSETHIPQDHDRQEEGASRSPPLAPRGNRLGAGVVTAVLRFTPALGRQRRSSD